MNGKITKLAITMLTAAGLQACGGGTTLTIEASNKGTVKSADGAIDCPETACIFDYAPLIQASGGAIPDVVLVAEANDGYKFSGFQFADTLCAEGTNANNNATCTVTMDTPKVIKAFFTLDGSDPCPNDPADNCLNNPNGDFDGDGIQNGQDVCPKDASNWCSANSGHLTDRLYRFDYPGLDAKVLRKGEHLVSQDGRFAFAMQGDGNLVLYKDFEIVHGNFRGEVLWASGTNNNKGDQLKLQHDGNLVLRDNDRGCAGQACIQWTAGSNTHSVKRLKLQNDGNVVIYNSSNQAVWATGTSGH